MKKEEITDIIIAVLMELDEEKQIETIKTIKEGTMQDMMRKLSGVNGELVGSSDLTINNVPFFGESEQET